MNVTYAIIVSDKITGERFTAYTSNDFDEAEGYRWFCEVTHPGAKVKIERYEWEEDR